MDKIFSDVSDHIITEYEGKEEVSDAELIDIIIQYYDSYSNGTFDGSSAAPEGLPEGAPEDVPAN